MLTSESRMMRRTCLIVTTLLFSLGCLPISLNTAVTNKDSIFDPLLVGVWLQKGKGNVQYEVKKGDSKAYDITFKTGNGAEKKMGFFLGKLFSINNERFIDFVPTKLSVKDSSAYNQFLYWPVHGFLHVRTISRDTVAIRLMKPEWLSDFLSKKPSTIEHIKVNYDVLLTASSQKLKKFIGEHLNTPGAFEEQTLLIRMGKKK